MNQQQQFIALSEEMMKAPFEKKEEVESRVLLLDRANAHKPWCDCKLCQRIRLKEGSERYSIRLKTCIRAKLMEMGGKEVAKLLEKMVNER